jgi:hypothetical protein
MISVYPNPVLGKLIVRFETSANPGLAGTIVVCDLHGRVIKLPATIQINETELNTTALPCGFYTIRVIDNKTGRSRIGKFVKQD